MSKLSRRDFIKKSMAVGATMVLASPNSRVRGANGDIRLAVIGVGIQGSKHINYFQKLEGVHVVAICDADKKHVGRCAVEYEKK